ncbi:MAG: 4-hydroxy-tetrahydrodipicolinate synthase [Betaproteobacteria bacterium]|nr:4-hydroxy-tetrahydrodipicolinate synthase [Betaproteobacteria bacterium]
MLTGSLVAIVTPMLPDGELDFVRLKSLIAWHIQEGTHGIVVVGTTGESATVDVDEHRALIEAAVEYADGRVPIIAGTGANSTKEAIQLTLFAKRAGASHALSVVPYYNKPTQEGLYRHFCAIAEAVDLPILLYNVPGRTSADLANDTVVRLAEIPHIVGLKDATANLARGADLLMRLTGSGKKPFGLYSGDDATTLALLMLGAHGTISVTANLAPRLMSEMCVAARKGDHAQAIAINNRLQGLHQNLFLESNPIPTKWALAQMGKIDTGIRLPLTPFAAPFHQPLLDAMRHAGIHD